MNRFLIQTVLLAVAAARCASQCGTCLQDNNPYACLTCYPTNDNIYFFSCPVVIPSSTPFILIAALITTLHLFMLLVGQGVYRDIFENIQLVTLINWRYGFGGGSLALQYTNLGTIRHNSFPDTFGSQFIVVMCILGVYWLLLIFVNHIPHPSLAALIKRKWIIVSTRVITFIFNMLLLASLLQLTTTATEPYFKTFAYVLAVLAIFKAGCVLLGLAVASNWKHFEVNDPNYYVLLE